MARRFEQGNMMHIIRWILAFVLVGLVAACDDGPEQDASSQPASSDNTARLAAHSKLFKKEIINPAPGVYVAVGYGLANSIMLEGDDGVVIVDTMEGRPQAQAVLADFRKLTKKPVKAIILTHNHTDHVFGGAVFAEEELAKGHKVPVYAHRSTERYIDKIVNVLADTIFARSMHMFGSLLPDDQVLNAGIGPQLKADTTQFALLRPTKVFDKSLDITVAGLDLKLLHMPGETEDQIAVWWPERKILLPGDNIYEAFPNLYTIRGTANRDLMQWVHSLDKLRDLEASLIVPSHTRPLAGAEKVEDVLRAYRDAIQYVHDQTVRGINMGMTPGQLVDFVKLPPHLRDHPWLTEFYGTVAWSVRSVFTGYLGWFDGDPTTLEPLSDRQRSERLAAAFTAGKPLADQARAALEKSDLQWASELARHWLNVEPDSKAARALLASALKAKAGNHINPNARHWYLTQSLVQSGDLEVGRPDTTTLPDDFLDGLPIDAFMAGMSTRLKAEDALEMDTVVGFEFSDVKRSFTVHLRKGVAALREQSTDKADVNIRTTATTWKRIATKKRNPALAYAAGEVEVDGGLLEVVKFLALFER
jgi:alkyl sulfatase BDS1-like metallo-beta-lactamase superfamily hydrolase